jgi:hypothetical protein
MDSIESLAVYFGDAGEWSTAAYQDMAWFLRRFGLRRPGYFRKGVRVPVKMHQGSPRVDPGGRVGLRRLALQSIAEQDEIGRRLKDGEVFIYSYVPGFRAALAAASAAWLPLPNGLSARLLRSAFQRTTLPVGGFVVAKVLGRSQERRLALTADIIYDNHREYWINGQVIATMARLVSEGKGVQPGVHFLMDAVDPLAFMAELRKGGVEQSESVELLG